MEIKRNNVRFKAVRASGPGGQRTNRRSTKVQLWVKIGNLPLREQDKKKLRRKLVRHLNRDDELWVYDQEERSREANKNRALARLNKIIKEALTEPTRRIPSQPPPRFEETRIRLKKIKSQKKKNRRKLVI